MNPDLRSIMELVIFLGLLFSVSAVAAENGARTTGPALTGVNLAGPDFNADKIPGKVGTDYIYPTADEIAYFAAKGAGVVRLPVLWERLQRSLGAQLDQEEVAHVSAVIDVARPRHVRVIIDIHNYARFNGKPIGASPVSVDDFAHFWGQLAAVFRDRPDVIFGLMNEPHDIPAEVWRKAVDGAIAAIRKAGSGNLILVPGVAWTNARDFVSGGYGTPNGVALSNIQDPSDNFAYEVHQYVDPGYTGTTGECIDEMSSVAMLHEFTDWLRRTKQRGFLGEFGVGRSPKCLAVLNGMLTYMRDNSDAWLGWTYWAAGPWWGDYHFTVEPLNGADRPQMKVLERFFR
ncbi:MAG: cellulase [Rhodospirillales bacterium]|nr:cellulase [Rhodospirillales bacterium]